jgi:hypothetical protein
MFIFAVGVLGFAPLLVLSVDGNTMSRDYSMANKLASDRIEQFESLDSITTFIPFQAVEDSLEGRFSRFTQVYDNTADTLLPPELARINVEVSWTDVRGVQRIARHTTLMEKVKP